VVVEPRRNPIRGRGEVVKSDLSPVPSPNGKGCLLANVDALREVQSALMPSILDKVFKGEL
jgi:hypothetical protein